MAAADQELPRKGDLIAGKYQVEGILGTGGMGAVFKVTHRVTGKCFAVKWLLPQLTSGSDATQRFIREAQVAGRVDHANVVEVYDVGQDGDSLYMVMELLQGEPLSQRLATAGRLPVGAACQILVPVTRGLAAAHKAGVIHRDLKPDNIFLCVGPSGEELPKVLDFGISKMSPLAAEVNVAITRDGMLMGTPHYMAPEQVRSDQVDPRTDVYALGVILYQLLAGELPFPGKTFPELMLKIMTETPRPLSELAPETPPELIAIVARAMARDVAERFESVTALGHALEPFADGVVFDITKPTPSTRPVARHPSSRPTPLATESQQLPSLPSSARPLLPRHALAAVGFSVLGVAFIGAIVSFSSSTQPAPVTRTQAASAATVKPRAPAPKLEEVKLEPDPLPSLDTRPYVEPTQAAPPTAQIGASDATAPAEIPALNAAPASAVSRPRPLEAPATSTPAAAPAKPPARDKARRAFNPPQMHMNDFLGD